MCFVLGGSFALLPASRVTGAISAVFLIFSFPLMCVASVSGWCGRGSTTVVHNHGDMSYALPYIPPDGPFGRYTVYNER
jgi:hypothetical protein